jgi:GNAT superfamily N-acetyltransferase
VSSEIRPAAHADLEPLVAALGQRRFFSERLASQRRGIGTALIHAGEDTARRLGHQRLAMGVGVDNPDARRLYERLGYTDWGHGTTVTSWQEHDPAGQPVTVSETIDMLVRHL